MTVRHARKRADMGIYWGHRQNGTVAGYALDPLGIRELWLVSGRPALSPGCMCLGLESVSVTR